jgi:integrase/recombinase XerC
VGLEAPGSARLVLVENVVHLDPAPAVFDAMLEGWRRQQSARFLKPSTITPRLRLIRRMERFSGLYPWQWAPADGEAFIDDMRGGESPIVSSTARSYEVTVSLFLEYLLDSRYGWARVCEERFGDTPQQVFHEGNSVLHKLDYEGDPRRRPLTYDEVQALFDAADARPGVIAAQGRKGALCAARDAAVLKTVYAFGLRRREASRLDLADLRRNRARAAVRRVWQRDGPVRQGAQGVAAQASDGLAGAGDGLGARHALAGQAHIVEMRRT